MTDILQGSTVILAPVLYLAHRVPFPPDKGDRIRTFNVLKYLASRGPVDLACLADEPVAPSSLEVLRGLCRRVEVIDHCGKQRYLRAIRSLAVGRSLSEGAFWSPKLAYVVEDWSRSTKYAAVLTSASSLGPYLDLPGVRDTPAIVDMMDVDSQKWRDYAQNSSVPKRWLYGLESRRVDRLERRLSLRARALLVVSETEAELFRRSCPTGPIRVVPNGVDLDYFRPGDGDGAGCVFVGALDYHPNVDAAVWFCREVWSAVRRRCPEARLRLVGRRPAIEVQRLASIDGVDVIGQVPDVRPYVAAAAVVVAPLRIARGVQNKVLEGMAMGKPMVASPEALQGLGQDRSSPAVVATTPAEWVDRVHRLLDDQAERRRLGTQGREYVERYHGWEPCLSALDELVQGSRGSVRSVLN